MTERWQRELRKLRDVEPTDGGWDRTVTRAPTGDGLPPPRERVIAGVVAFGVFIAAASFGWLAFRPTGGTDVGTVTEPSRLVLTARADPAVEEPGSIALTVDGVPIEGAPGTYSMAGEEADGTGWSSIGDAVGPEFSKVDFVPVTADAALDLRGNYSEVLAGISMSADPFDDQERFDPTTGRLPSLEAGYHVIQFNVRWDFPDLDIQNSWFFPVDIIEGRRKQPAEAVVPDVLHASCTNRGVEVDEPNVSVQRDGLHVQPREMGAGVIMVLKDANGMFLSSDGTREEWIVEAVPGVVTAACLPEDRVDGSAEFDELDRDGVRVVVKDPLGAFVPLKLPCGDPQESSPRVMAFMGIDPNDAEATLRSALTGVLESDSVEPAGYVEGVDEGRQWWRIVREGEIVASFFVSGAGGGYVPISRICSDSGISLPREG